MQPVYRTLSGPGEALYKEKGSRFLAFARPVDDRTAVREVLDDLRGQFHDARHHCYAWVLNDAEKSYRANDDGEPNHSAGDPILGQIRALDLLNVLVVVVR
ncbi:MAG: YigZ family protein, partial [Catalinimonas sp.]